MNRLEVINQVLTKMGEPTRASTSADPKMLKLLEYFKDTSRELCHNYELAEGLTRTPFQQLLLSTDGVYNFIDPGVSFSPLNSVIDFPSALSFDKAQVKVEGLTVANNALGTLKRRKVEGPRVSADVFSDLFLAEPSKVIADLAYVDYTWSLLPLPTNVSNQPVWPNRNQSALCVVVWPTPPAASWFSATVRCDLASGLTNVADDTQIQMPGFLCVLGTYHKAMMDKYGADHPDAMQAEKVYISAVGNYNQQYSQDQGSGSAEWVPE